jgi:hypothetical protein
MKKNDITIPLELFDGRFSLEEISTISMILASPHLSLKTREQWGDDQTCNELADKLVRDGIIKFHEDKIEINIQEKQPINMEDNIIYDNMASAKAACKQYAKALHDLQEKLGVWEENEDSCVSTHIYTQYRDESGKVVEYCYF